MADPTGFLRVAKVEVPKRPVDERVGDWREVYEPQDPQDRAAEVSRQARRCMDCGIPFCHSGTAGCPLGNLIPEWNDLLWRDEWQDALERLHAALPVAGAVILVVLSMVLTLIGGLIPSRKAAKQDPATALRTEPLAYAGRDQVSPQAGRDAAAALWKAAGIKSPIDEIDVAEIYVPFSWFEPMWLENLGFAAEGEGWKLTEAGETAIGGKLPVNASGGVLSSNPIGASGMIRFAESAIQVMGKAGDHQVEGARKALGHAYGGGAQYYSMWVVSSDKPGK